GGGSVMRPTFALALACGVAIQCLCGASAKDNTDTDSVGVVVTTNGGTAQPRVEIVVVTAEKRVESSQNVPVALTALSGSALDSQGIVGFKELGMRVPSLRFGSG